MQVRDRPQDMWPLMEMAPPKKNSSWEKILEFLDSGTLRRMDAFMANKVLTAVDVAVGETVILLALPHRLY